MTTESTSPGIEVVVPAQAGPGDEAGRLPGLSADAPVEEFVDRLFRSTLGALEVISVYLGDRLGYYRALAQHGPQTPAQLAARCGTHERYTREWLEQQAVNGLLRVTPSGDGRAYSLGDGAREVLTTEHSLNYLAPIGGFVAAVGGVLPELLDAYRTGGGVGWAEMGPDAREAQAALNRPWFEQALAPALAGLPDLHQILSRPGARILDIGSGGAHSSVALAVAYPDATVVGIDIDPATVTMAQDNVAQAGLEDRVEVRLADAGSLGADGSFDAAFAFECVHDMPDPVAVLAAARRAVNPDGAVVVVDEAVADEFTAPGDELERFMYGASILICLPDSMSATPSVATGTVMRRSTLESYATQAGFSATEVLPVEGFSFFRFYRLRH